MTRKTGTSMPAHRIPGTMYRQTLQREALKRARSKPYRQAAALDRVARGSPVAVALEPGPQLRKKPLQK